MRTPLQTLSIYASQSEQDGTQGEWLSGTSLATFCHNGLNLQHSTLQSGCNSTYTGYAIYNFLGIKWVNTQHGLFMTLKLKYNEALGDRFNFVSNIHGDDRVGGYELAILKTYITWNFIQ
jgi:hypothetical protein